MKRYLTDLIFMSSLALMLFSGLLLSKKFPPGLLSFSSSDSSTAAIPSNEKNLQKQDTQRHSHISTARIKPQTQGKIVVASDGAGDTTSLADALNQIKEGEELILKEEIYNWPEAYTRLKGIKITGSGQNTVLKINNRIGVRGKTFEINNLTLEMNNKDSRFFTFNSDIKLSNLQIKSNSSESILFNMYDVSITISHVKLNGSDTGFSIKNPKKAYIDDLSIQNAKFGIRLDSSNKQEFSNLNFLQIQRYALRLNQKSGAEVICKNCNFDQNKTNVPSLLKEIP